MTKMIAILCCWITSLVPLVQPQLQPGQDALWISTQQTVPHQEAHIKLWPTTAQYGLWLSQLKQLSHRPQRQLSLTADNKPPQAGEAHTAELKHSKMNAMGVVKNSPATPAGIVSEVMSHSWRAAMLHCENGRYNTRALLWEGPDQEIRPLLPRIQRENSVLQRFSKIKRILMEGRCLTRKLSRKACTQRFPPTPQPWFLLWM